MSLLLADWFGPTISDRLTRSQEFLNSGRLNGEHMLSLNYDSVFHLPVLFYGYWFLFVLITLIAAVSVYTDAKRQRRCALGIWPIWWGAAALVGPIVGVGLYWALHHSTLRIEAERQ